MEKAPKIANKFVKAAAAVLALFGTVIAVILLVSSFTQGFDWYRFLPAVLYILCFVVLFLYAFTKGKSSPRTFQTVLLSYGLVVLVTGLIFPPVFPHGTKWLFFTLSALILLGLFLFNMKWADVKLSKVILTLTYIFEVAIAIAALRGNPMVMDEDFVARCAVWIRPIILGDIAVCYLGRMYEKSKAK